MKKSYLLAFGLWTREQMKTCLDSISIIEKWRYDTPNAFYIVSEASAQQISEEIRKNLGTLGRFIVTEINPTNSQGWLTKESWYLINNKEYLKE